MKFNNKNFTIFLLTLLFLVGLSSSITINYQYGFNSSYNEIEHSETKNQINLNEIIEEHAKVCEKLIDFRFGLNELESQKKYLPNEIMREFVILSNPTPPPELLS